MKRSYSRKKLRLNKRYSYKKIGGSSAVAKANPQSLITITIGNCGKSGLFGRSSCVVLKPTTNILTTKVVLYLNKHNQFQVRFFTNENDNKYEAEVMTHLNYNDNINKIITWFNLAGKITASEIIDKLINEIELNRGKIHNGTVMLERLQSFMHDTPSISPRSSSRKSSSRQSSRQSSVVSYEERQRAKMYKVKMDQLDNFKECLENLDAKDIVNINKDGKCIFGQDIPQISYNDLQTHKKHKISQANECVTNKMKGCNDADNDLCLNVKIVIENQIREAEKSNVIKINGKDVSMTQCTS